jgi:hypothetical protein
MLERFAMGPLLLPLGDGKQLYLGLMSAVLLWTASLALSY